MRILNVKDTGVTRGVINETMHVEPDLREVTFTDYAGVPHTVHAHHAGPWQEPRDIIEAWYRGDLHDRPAEPEPGADGAHTPTGGGY